MDQTDKRMSDLSKYIESYLQDKEQMDASRQDVTAYLSFRARILDHLNATLDDWQNWKWQMSHRYTKPDLLAQIISFNPDQLAEIQQAVQYHRMAISPFTLARLAGAGKPIAQQFIPSLFEVQNHDIGVLDPMVEEQMSPVPHLTRRYPDRVILNVTNMCGSFCRFCQRRRNHGSEDLVVPSSGLEPAFVYLKEHHEIRDVLITGGDPLTLNDQHLSSILERLRQIPSVEIIRIGTRMPVVIPQRITVGLAKIVRKFAPLYINIHINHPLEITSEMEQASHKLLLSGAVLGSQTVLLKGINDSAHVLRYLYQLLLTLGIKPYYLFHAKDVAGTEHFRTPVSQGLTLIESLQGVTSGLTIPNYAVSMPGGLGKVILKDQANINSLDDDPILFKTWENKIIPYPNKNLGSGN